MDAIKKMIEEDMQELRMVRNLVSSIPKKNVSKISKT